MSNTNHWTSTVITGARKTSPSVTNDASDRIEGLLKGELSERSLPQGALKSLARELIKDMVPVPPKPEATQ